MLGRSFSAKSISGMWKCRDMLGCIYIYGICGCKNDGFKKSVGITPVGVQYTVLHTYYIIHYIIQY